MFTWICQKCGSEVPPSENDCPNCRARAAASTPQQAVSSQPSPLVSAVSEPPVSPVSAPPAPPAPAAAAAPDRTMSYSSPPPYVPPASVPPSFTVSAPPPVRSGPSPTMVAIGSALGLLAVLAVLYLYVLPKTTGKSEAVTLESPATAGDTASAVPTHPLAKYIEIAGLRIIEEGRGQVKIAYVVVNHSPADLPALQAQLAVGAGGKPIFEFQANIPSIGPYETKDLSTSVRTKLQPYELPDWQKVTPSLKIISER